MKSNLLNLGPQHPASHEVLRLILNINGEYVLNINSQIGYLHRGTEKLIEYSEIKKNLPYFDRLDYVSNILMEESFSNSIENIFSYTQTKKNILYEKIILNELSRISNHLLTITTNLMDLGALTPFLWAFEIREKICEFFEKISGARMHSSIIKPFQKNIFFSNNFYIINTVFNLIQQLKKYFLNINNLFFNNKIIKSRLKNIGRINYISCEKFATSGPVIKSTGKILDNRILSTYIGYNNINNLINSKNIQQSDTYMGDNYDRVCIRFSEIEQSTELISNIFFLFSNNLKHEKKEEIKINKQSMEHIIQHFKNETQGSKFNKNLSFKKKYIFSTIESSKGEMALFLNLKKKNNKLYRIKIKSPDFLHLQQYTDIAKKHIITDVLSILGSLDIILGSIDK